jgi:DNA-binding transcriptional ArsR family regulator
MIAPSERKSRDGQIFFAFLPPDELRSLKMSRTSAGAKRISDQALKRIAVEFKTLSDPVRLRILSELRTGERNVTEIVDATKGTQSNVSKHLAVLHKAGCVARRKEGLKVFYTICDPTVNQLCDLMCAKFKTHFEKTRSE